MYASKLGPCLKVMKLSWKILKENCCKHTLAVVISMTYEEKLQL